VYSWSNVFIFQTVAIKTTVTLFSCKIIHCVGCQVKNDAI